MGREVVVGGEENKNKAPDLRGRGSKFSMQAEQALTCILKMVFDFDDAVDNIVINGAAVLVVDILA